MLGIFNILSLSLLVLEYLCGSWLSLVQFPQECPGCLTFQRTGFEDLSHDTTGQSKAIDSGGRPSLNNMLG